MIEKITHIINDGILLKIAFIMLLLGFATIPLSNIAHVDKVKINQSYVIDTNPGIDVAILEKRYADNKEVGYLSAINWWPNNTLIIPLLVTLMAWLISSINKTNTLIVDLGMAVSKDSNNTIRLAQSIKESWIDALKSGVKVWLILSLVAFLYSYYEYFSESYRTLSVGIIDPSISPDWTVGCLLADIRNCNLNTNQIFNAYAFTLQGINASFGLLLFCIAGSYGFFIYSHTNYNDDWFFIPNIKSSDPRKGFEVFEEIGMLLLTLGIVAYTGVYFIILQNLYLLDAISTTLFGGEDPFLTYAINFDDSLKFIDLSDISSVIALVIGFLVVIILVVVVPAVTLSVAAFKARDNYIHNNSNAVQNELTGMVIWPYKWVKINILIIALTLSIFGLFIPSLALHLATLYFSALLIWIGTVIKMSFKIKEVK